ncbi:MAG: 4-hydroxy-3-methylbut-2-enyl diphosphate reductase [Armatimonadota bacterium]|nr:4-hydroxy-3-methylbut-2-enyl diphosphate reductase [Armatimonadota bacterium]MDR7460800.1 4-hydroxy-3-methylbut-2-enyl diphosphate reductase [Armatimonadota bacterium]MDR7476494.1 4-hydroxy-3-methylbut-2-enyl diphosphate reductase [Armatimonadota bacterium]MDR7513266.1 4-hydroxy-3-methylbut-2-enyl diphosphate reductase [Armatimonadota bacterium]MDR7564819.1 4-hydroxy-3-methylbut-2-enyl diphosphate reductase [Armatimonadota bacterium]
MRVVVARHMGFCGGVRRAVDLAVQAARNGQGGATTWGPLIHNPQEVGRLQREGVRVAERLEDLDGGAFVVSAYGVESAVLDAVRQRGMRVVDATCPVVTRAHELAERLAEEGYFVVAVGDHGHPEMVTLKEKLGDRVAVVHTPEEAARLRLRGKVGVLSQTTQSLENFRRIVADIVTRVKETKVINTLCPAITVRQEEAHRLVEEVDVLLVVGGRGSSNTTRLAEIGRQRGVATYHVETADELQPSWFSPDASVGVMSGASTPDWIIEQVLQRLDEIRTQLGG